MDEVSRTEGKDRVCGSGGWVRAKDTCVVCCCVGLEGLLSALVAGVWRHLVCTYNVPLVMRGCCTPRHCCEGAPCYAWLLYAQALL